MRLASEHANCYLACLGTELKEKGVTANACMRAKHHAILHQLCLHTHVQTCARQYVTPPGHNNNIYIALALAQPAWPDHGVTGSRSSHSVLSGHHSQGGLCTHAPHWGVGKKHR